MLGRNKTQRDAYMLKKVLKMFRTNQLRRDHALQREAGQWDNDAKSSLVSTIIKQEDVDPIKICEQFVEDCVNPDSVREVLWLIDGLQRLSVCDEFQNNVFKITKNIKFPIVSYQNETGEWVEFDLRGKFYKDLPEEIKDEFENYQIDIRKHLDCDDDDISYHMGRYNNHVGMNINQKNILVMPNVAKNLKDIYNNQDFFNNNGIYTESEVVKGTVKKVISESIMAMFHLDKWKRGKALAKYLNENAKDEEFETFKSELSRLEKVVDQNTVGELFNSKNSFLFFALFHKFTKYNLEDVEFKKFLEAFRNELKDVKFKKYDNDSFATYDKKKNTKDKKVVVTKLDMLEILMKDFLGIEEKESNVIEVDCIEIPDELSKYVSNFTKYISVVESGIHDEETANRVAIQTLEFVKENVNEDKIDEDIELYLSFMDDFIKTGSVLLKADNLPSLVSIMAHACDTEHDEEFSAWLIDYEKRHPVFNRNQKENYTYMKADFDKYIGNLKQNDKGAA